MTKDYVTLRHSGVKGMHWGHRKTKTSVTTNRQTAKNHLTVNDSGTLTISNKQATKKGKRNFVIRGVVSVALMSASVYAATHPFQVMRGEERVKQMFSKTITEIKPKKVVDSGIFSKSLGRMLSVAEALDAGLDLSDEF